MNSPIIKQEPLFCSIIIPTVGRPSLNKAVESVLNQEVADGANFEIIVVNDSGHALAAEDWQNTTCVRIIDTNQRERCVARNTGAAVARGEYLWFLDDDDWILPGALRNFWSLASDAPSADWLYGGVQIIDGEGRVLAELNTGLHGNCFAQIMGGAWAPIQASIVKTDAFFKVGGFNQFIIGTEDLDLCRKVAMIGEFANTEAAVGGLFRGEQWTTSTNYLRAPSDTRQSRDNLLNEPGAYSRMHSSAGSAYWYGRIVRVYLSTINFNIQKRQFLKVIERVFLSVASTIHAGGAVFSKQFWAGVRADHVPDTLHFIMMDLENTPPNST